MGSVSLERDPESCPPFHHVGAQQTAAVRQEVTPPVPWTGASRLQTETYNSVVTRSGVSRDHSPNLMKSEGAPPAAPELSPPLLLDPGHTFTTLGT